MHEFSFFGVFNKHLVFEVLFNVVNFINVLVILFTRFSVPFSRPWHISFPMQSGLDRHMCIRKNIGPPHQMGCSFLHRRFAYSLGDLFYQLLFWPLQYVLYRVIQQVLASTRSQNKTCRDTLYSIQDWKWISALTASFKWHKMT